MGKEVPTLEGGSGEGYLPWMEAGYLPWMGEGYLSWKGQSTYLGWGGGVTCLGWGRGNYLGQVMPLAVRFLRLLEGGLFVFFCFCYCSNNFLIIWL